MVIWQEWVRPEMMGVRLSLSRVWMLDRFVWRSLARVLSGEKWDLFDSLFLRGALT
jgi:hypothetical protein